MTARANSRAEAATGGSLLDRLESGVRRFDWAQPTAVQRLSALDIGGAAVWVKRDDQTSTLYGGGKVRKLAWLLANPPFDGRGPIVSVGGTGSHHLLALALFLAHRLEGRRLHALCFEQTPTPHVRTNLATLTSCDAKLWVVPRRLYLPWAFLGYYVWRRPVDPGVFMSAGASEPVGCFGFVEAGLELAAQIARGEMPRPSRIYIAAGTAGSCAGLAIGLAIAGCPTHLHLVSSVEPLLFNRVLFQRKCRAVWKALRAHGFASSHPDARGLLAAAGVTWSIDHREVGAGYGVPTPACESARALGAEHGLVLESTYTAKCLAALRRHEASRPPGDRVVLLWNTHASNDLAPFIDPD